MKDNNNEIPRNEPPRPYPKYLPWSFEGHWQPWYDDRRDYNTNAPSYYDYLAHQKFLSNEAIDLINRNARRNFYVTDTNSIDLTKKGDWVDNENPCTSKDWQPTKRERYYYDDIVEIVADLKVSPQKVAVTIAGMTQTCPNVLRVLTDGAFVPDYTAFIADLRNRVSSAEGEINQNKNNITQLENDLKKTQNDLKNTQAENAKLKEALQKIVTNLHQAGAITSDNIDNFTFNNNTYIANGNINIYAQNAGSNTLIKTHATNSNKTGDIVVGLNTEAPK